MDTPGYPQNDPSLLLLNEIEILLAQTRLMELYLNQAQVNAAHKAVGVEELHQAELAALRRALPKKNSLPRPSKASSEPMKKRSPSRSKICRFASAISKISSPAKRVSSAKLTRK